MARRLKVGFLCQPYDLILPPVQNSIGLWAFEVARRLSPTCDVTVYGPSRKGGPAEATHDGARFHLLPPGAPFGPARPSASGGQQDIRQPEFARDGYFRDYAARIASDMRGQDFDIVHVINFTQFASFIKRSDPNAKTVLNMRCDWLSGLDPAMIRRRLRDVDLILGCSDYITESIRRSHPEVGERCATVHNGTDIERFVGPDAEGPATGADGGRIIVVGRVSPEKGIHVLLEALDQVLDRFPQTKLTIAGPVVNMPVDFFRPMFADPKLKALEPLFGGKYAEFLKRTVPPRVAGRTVFKGMVPHAGLIGLYQGADLLAFPSVWHEPFGIPLVEAMACGLPVVATRGGGVPEIVEDGKTGILVDRGDAAALAQGIIRLLGDDALRARMGQAGRRRAVERFSWETVAENLLACYERVLGATP